MSLSVIVGLQWGDEGKGKITDLLANQCDYIIRYQGGNNAGHSLSINKKNFILYLVPSGVIYTGKKCIIGAGVVVDSSSLIKELNNLETKGINTSQVYIDQRVHLTLPYHRLLDKYKEESLGKCSIGTTLKGIGPTYEDQIARIGIRMIDLLNIEVFKKKLSDNIKYKNKIITKIYNKDPLDFKLIYNEYIEYSKILRPRIIDSVYEIHHAIKENKKILFEGAQAILLDMNYGTYPYVTTSYPSTGGVCIGSGIPPTAIQNLIGITKAYCTRVGSGPFPTELKDEIGEKLRKVGKEYGSTTQRPRRCGWLDLVSLKYACMINGINNLIITKLDILSEFKKIQICTSYQDYNGNPINYFPTSIEAFNNLHPVYIDLFGWEEDISNINQYKNLPKNCKKYIEFIENQLGINISIISVGADRYQNIIKNIDFAKKFKIHN